MVLVKRRIEQFLDPKHGTASWGRPRGKHAVDPMAKSGDSAHNANDSAAVHAETDIAGHRVIRLLGTGDRAVVFLGYSGAGNAVALKVFHAHTEAASIEREIAVLTSAAAPGLVRLLDIAQLSDGRSCLILERLTGGSLAKYLVEYPRLSPGEAVTILAPVTVALGAMHTGGFVHGNLSQATILLDANGRPVVTGFGSTRRLSAVPRERMLRLRDDWGRLALIYDTVFEAVEATQAQRLDASVLLRRFQATVSPTPAMPVRSDAGAHHAAMLNKLEHDLFDWAVAEPLRGFQVVARLNSDPVDAHALTAFHVPEDDIWNHHTGVGVNSGGAIVPAVAMGVDDRVHTELDRDGQVEFVDESPGRGDSSMPNRPVSLVDRVLWALSERVSAIVHGLKRQARRSWMIESVLDSNPLAVIGHVLRRRLHGHRRPILIAALGGGSLLTLALALLPVSWPAGESVASGSSGTSIARDTNGGPVAVATSALREDAVGLADSAADNPTDQRGQQVGPGGAQSPDLRDSDVEDHAAIVADDAVAAVRALLRRRAACLAAASLVCLVNVDQTGSAVMAADSYEAVERQRGGFGRNPPDYRDHDVSLAERSGDLAVVAVIPSPGHENSQPASVLVVKGEGGWRLREIFDY